MVLRNPALTTQLYCGQTVGSRWRRHRHIRSYMISSNLPLSHSFAPLSSARRMLRTFKTWRSLLKSSPPIELNGFSTSPLRPLPFGGWGGLMASSPRACFRKASEVRGVRSRLRRSIELCSPRREVRRNTMGPSKWGSWKRSFRAARLAHNAW